MKSVFPWVIRPSIGLGHVVGNWVESPLEPEQQRGNRAGRGLASRVRSGGGNHKVARSETCPAPFRRKSAPLLR